MSEDARLERERVVQYLEAMSEACRQAIDPTGTLAAREYPRAQGYALEKAAREIREGKHGAHRASEEEEGE